MTAMQLNAALFHELNIIATDESMMEKAEDVAIGWNNLPELPESFKRLRGMGHISQKDIDKDDQLEYIMGKSLRSMLKLKHAEGIASNREHDGHPSWLILVSDSKIEKDLGYVGKYISVPPYFSHIDYEDITNRRVNKSSNMDDL